MGSAQFPLPSNSPQPYPVAPSGAAVQFATQQVPPPSPLYVRTEDQLLVQIWIPTAGFPKTVNIELRWMRPDGTIVPLRFPVLVQNMPQTFVTVLGEGFILSITASTANNIARGQCFCQAFLVRQQQEDVLFGWALISDYVSRNFHPTWPGGVFHSPLEGPGYSYTFTVSAPAAGSSQSVTVPASVRWRLQSGQAQLTTGVAVANRQFQFSMYPDGSHMIYTVLCPNTQAASLTYQYVGSPLSFFAGAGPLIQNYPLPPQEIFTAGTLFGFSAILMQAADQFQAAYLHVEEWIDI